MQHQPPGLSERFDQQSGRNVSDDYHRNDPAEYQAEKPWKDRIRITRNVEEIKIAVNQALGAHDPKTDRCQGKHDGVVHYNTKPQRNKVKQKSCQSWYDIQTRKRYANDDAP